MPCTTTQNTIGATIIEISFRKASLKIFRLMAKSGTAMPSTIPSSNATRTWTNSDVYSGFRAIGTAAERVDIGRFPSVQGVSCPKKEQQACQPAVRSQGRRLFRRLGGLCAEHARRRRKATRHAVGHLDLILPRQPESAGDHVLHEGVGAIHRAAFHRDIA